MRYWGDPKKSRLLPLRLILVLGAFPKRLILPTHSQACLGLTLCSAPQTSQCMWLMQALGFLLSALQVEEILKNLHSLISPYIQQLEKLAEEIVSELSACLCVFMLYVAASSSGSLGLPFVWAVA